MKLIRLTTENEQGIFDCTFNEDVIIEPYSKIALHNITAEIDTTELTIDAQNDLLEWYISSTNPKSTHMPNGIYNMANIDTFFSNLGLSMNRAMSYNKNEIGSEWKVGKTQGNKTAFNVKQGVFFKPISYASTNEFFVKCAKTTSFIARNAGTPGQFDAFYYVRTAQCKGSSTLRIKYFSNSGSSNVGMILGFLTTPPPANASTINLADLTHAIQLVNNSVGYSVIFDGSSSNTSTTPQLSDNIDIRMFNEKIQFVIVRDSGAQIVLKEETYDHVQDLFPVVLFIGDQNARFSNLVFTSSPFYGASIDNSKLTPPDDSLAVVLPNVGAYKTTRNIKIVDIDVASALGYSNNIYSSPAPETASLWVAENQLTLVDLADSYVVELMNINVESYDALTKQRRNILHTISQIEIIKERLTYQAPFPLFLDINNRDGLTLRRIRARILKEDMSPADIRGIAVLSVIVKSPKEN